MAEQIPYDVVVNIISKLASFAFREIGRAYGVMDELEKLNETVECIQAVLSDAEERQHEDRAVKTWICRLKEVVHGADNLFDDLLIEDLRRKVNGDNKVRDFFSSKNRLVFRRKMARRVEKIRQKFNDVSNDISNLNLNRRTVIFKENDSSWRETGSFGLPSEIIGREESKKEIIDLLEQSHANQNVSLIAVVGIGGLGKTALAQLVYNDADVQKLFQKKMWVCISEDFEVKTVLNKILESLNGSAAVDLQLDQLQKKLYEKLNGQRYLLVVDDVWDESQLKWNALRAYLMCGCEGSKILVTTRSTSMAQTMGINTPYVLEGLTKEQSWTLLKKVAFGDDASRMSPDLESIGERIAEKCRGVPLAIRTVGGLLQSKREENEWMKILDGDFWRLYGEKESIMPVLKLSYQNLPVELRQCFAYCCLYPKDWKITKDELVQLWMAQGYIESSTGTESMEDVGNEYVKILLMKSFFQDASVDENGAITEFKMHDLMHDLATLVAANDCCLHNEGKEIIGRPMHISFLSCSSSYSFGSVDGSNLRTIIGLDKMNQFVTIPSFILNLKYLRVLNLSHSSMTKLSESIDKLKHLRYLDLSSCAELISLPESIGNLVMLQTLKLKWCSKLVFRVKVITKLTSLRHLEINFCKAFEEMMPAGLRKLTSLQYLSNFVVGDDAKSKSAKLNELKELNNIGGNLMIENLGLVKDVKLESQDANLKAKKHIQHLCLFWGEKAINKNDDSLQLLDNLCPHENLRKLAMNGYPGVRFSSWLPSLNNIVEIYLVEFSNCQHLPPLEKLPCLKILVINEMEKLEHLQYEEISRVFFPALEILVFNACKNLSGWLRLGDYIKPNDIHSHLSLPPFPRLSYLRISRCPNLTCMPTFPHLVEQLDLQDCSVKPVIETCLVQFDSSSSYPLSTLRHLQISAVREVEAMKEEWMQNLTSLRRLSIFGPSSIRPLLRHLQYLRSELQELEITFFDDDKLDLWKNEEDNSMQCNVPPYALASLHIFSIKYCEHLKALPEQIGDLQSLRHIMIYNCPKLESLPEAMHRLTNLQTLRIKDCPLLHGRCEADIRQDWPMIAHIPNIIRY